MSTDNALDALTARMLEAVKNTRESADSAAASVQQTQKMAEGEMQGTSLTGAEKKLLVQMQSIPPARPAGCISILGRARAGGPCKGVKKMKDTICTVIGLIGGTIAALFGGWDTALQTLVIFMAIDYITGLVVAGVFHASPKTKTGALESKAGWKGLIRKGETLLIVLVACQLDAVIGGSFVRDAAIIGFSANEAISIVENAGLMGLPIPAAITKAIDILKQRAETPEKGKD